MKCSKCKRLLVGFSEERLTDESYQEIRKHISDCSACRQELDDLRSSLRLVGDARELEAIPDPPGDFAERVMSRVHQDSVNYSPFRRLAFGLIAVSCLLGLGMVLLFYGGFLERQYPVPPASEDKMMVETEDPDNMLSLDHIKRELVRVLDQTLEAIERSEQEWEVEI